MRLPFQLNGFPPRVGLGGTTMPNGLGKGSGGERKTHMKKAKCINTDAQPHIESIGLIQ